MGVAACTLLLLIVTTCNVDKLTNSQPPVATLAVAPGKLSQTAAVGSMALRLDSVALANAGDGGGPLSWSAGRSEEHTSELQSRRDLVCRLLLEKKKKKRIK